MNPVSPDEPRFRSNSHHRIAMRFPVWALFLILHPADAMARCMPFDFFDSVDDIPYIVFGEVVRSNADTLGSGSCLTDPCRHRFGIRVLDVLKGDVARDDLAVEYDYVEKRPNTDLFHSGEAFVFAIGQIGTDGEATLFGTSCGRAGLPADSLHSVRQALR